MQTHDPSPLDYLTLLRESKRIDASALSSKVRIAILADCSTQHLVPVLAALLARARVAAEFYEAGFDTIAQEIYDGSSGLYAFTPDVVLVLSSSEALRGTYYERVGDKTALAEEVADERAAWWDAIHGRSSATVIQSNYVVPHERLFGNYDTKVPGSLSSVFTELNHALAHRARTRGHVLVNDCEALASYVGKKAFVDEKLWTLAKSPCAFDALPLLAKNIVDIVLATRGRVVKCVVLDLDNTLWGGVVGDDGLSGIAIGHFGEGEPFHRLQQFLRELKRRGVVLAVCSKNEHAAAIQAFREHPEMVLREDDIAVFVANWESKVDNIKAIRETLNIGFDSMVFLDDNPFERNMVRTYLPEVIVPELPEEPSLYIRAIAELNLFETSAFTDEDRQRSDLYREEGARRTLERSFTSVGEYLASLEMRVTCARFDAFHLPRVAQLTQRSNQFNLTTRRYGLAECEAQSLRSTCEPLYVRLSDRFGDYGLIAVVVLEVEPERLRIDQWLMSCRVLVRGVEEFMMNRVVRVARERGLPFVVGEYLPTSKNAMVREFYGRFGFEKVSEGDDGATTWRLDVATYEPRSTYLTEAQPETSG